MPKPIQQSVNFDASAKRLYDIYMSPKLHAAVTGSPVTISSKSGSKFRAFNGMIGGITLAAVPGKLIVQRWRSVHFKPTDPDSILVLTITQDAKRGRIDLVHINVPKQDYQGVTRGWKTYYWEPLRAYLKC